MQPALDVMADRPEPTTATERRQASYRPDIDGVRALAVLLVMAFHAFPVWVPGGFVGVDIFFIISGYLITGTILRDVGGGSFTFLQFYARRFRRIVPALAIVLAGTLIVGVYVLLPAELEALGRHVWAGAAFVNNLVLWRESGYFDGAAATKPLLHLWSLGIEEQFYLLWPPLLLIAVRRRLNLVRLMSLLAAASFALNVGLIGQYEPTTFYLLPTRFWELLVGAILVQLEFDFAAAKSSAFRPMLGTDATSVLQNAKAWTGLGVALIAAAALSDGSAFPGWRAAMPVAAASLLISAGPNAWLNRVVFSSRPAVALGLMSYPLYLWHWPMLSFARIVEGDVPSRTIRVASLLMASLFAWLTWRLVEQPARRLFPTGGSRRTMRACVAASVTALGCLAAVGATLQARHGFPDWFAKRFPEHSAELSDLTAVPSPQNAFPRCSGTFSARAELGWCNTARGGDAQIGLLGDSHALYLFPGFADVFAARGVNSLVTGHSACAPLLDVRSFLKGTVEACSAANRLAIDLLANDPEIHTVVLSSLGPYYFSGTSFAADHGLDEAPNWVLAPLDGSPVSSKEAIFERGYSATIGRLALAGKRVVFFIDVPELDFHPASCLDVRPISITRRPRRNPCGVPTSVVTARQARYRAVIARLAVAHPEMRAFDPLPFLCGEALCSAVRAGRLVYRDSNHLSAFGSAYLSEKLEVWMRSAF